MTYPGQISLCLAHRHRSIQSATVVYILCVSKHGSIPRCPNICRDRFCFESFVASFSPRLFKRLYRMDRVAFERLCELVGTRSETTRRASCRLSVSAKVSMTLRWLAGGSYLDISMSHFVSIPTFYFVIDQVIADFDNILTMRFRFDDAAYLQNCSDGFSRYGRSPLSGCAGAVDGIAIRIQEPARGSVPNPSTYYNRKGFFAIAVQAMCDHRYVFTFSSAISPGSTHDSIAFGMSSLSRLLSQNEGGLLQGYWIAADDAYVCRERLLTPWPGRNLSRSMDSFNYWQSSARIHIEQAFGMLVARWGVLWRSLRVPIDKAGIIVIVCMKLHNFIIETFELSLVQAGSALCVPDPSGIDNVGHRDAADMIVHLQNGLDTDDVLHRRRRDLEVSVLREEFTRMIDDDGIVRPQV
jgi:hypothetical protein